MLETHTSFDPNRPIGEPRSLRKIDFAKAVNLSPSRVTRMIQQGMPVEPDGRIDVARGKLWMRENIDPRRSAAQPQGSLSFEKPEKINHRERLAREQADRVALQNAILRNEYVKADEVEREWSDLIRQARSAFLAVPSRLRQLLPGLSADEVATIDGELRRVLEELARAE